MQPFSMTNLSGMLGVLATLLLSNVASGQQPDGLGAPIASVAPFPSARSMSWPDARVSPAQLEALLGPQVSRALRNLEPDRISSRSAADASLFKRLSPSVVLVVTNEGIGSGSVVRSPVEILTNWHVVAGYKEVGVVFKPVTEGAEPTRADFRRAQVVRVDEVSDLALLRVANPPEGRNPIPLGAMAGIAVGNDVHAIGHPTGEAWTYTKGIVSQVRRNYQWVTEEALEHVADVVQTQTPINPGNSGGPLFDSQGQLVGVNSFISQGEGLNFAVAVSAVNRLLDAKADRVAARRGGEPASVGSANCEVRIVSEGRLKGEAADLTIADTDCDGKADTQYVVPDKASDPISLRVDTNGDGQIDVVVVDGDRDGKWDASVADTNGDGKPDLRGFHEDGAVAPTRVEKMAD